MYGVVSGNVATSSLTPTQAPDAGISTAMKELINEISENSNLTDNLRSSLGISTPPESGAKSAVDNLFGMIRDLTYKMRTNNGCLSDVLRHLNS